MLHLKETGVPSRLGPNPPDSLAQIQMNTFSNVLAACGCPPGLFESGADGTSQRESVRRFHTNLVMPMARLLSSELTSKLETEVKLTFDLHQHRSGGQGASLSKAGSGRCGSQRGADYSGIVGCGVTILRVSCGNAHRTRVGRFLSQSLRCLVWDSAGRRPYSQPYSHTSGWKGSARPRDRPQQMGTAIQPDRGNFRNMRLARHPLV